MKNIYRLSFSILVCLIISNLALNAKSLTSVPPPKPIKTDMMVGAYYYPGWHLEDRWYSIAANSKVQHPLLGYYKEGNPEAADWQIKWAIEHGISFFAFDYYSSEGSSQHETALDDGFLKSSYINKFKFCINWCNIGPSKTMTVEEMDRFADMAIEKYLKNPSYLKVNNKPVIMMLAGTIFLENLGQEGAKFALQRLQDKCKAAGFDGAYVVFCEGGVHSPDEIRQAKSAGVDAFCLYNYPYAGTDLTGPGKYQEESYFKLQEEGAKVWDAWKEFTNDAFWPTVMAGWDRRPWLKDTDLVRTGFTPDLFAKSLRRSRKFVNKDKIVMIEAWNEWGEGSVIEPSKEMKFAYLDKVREIFCRDKSAHKDIDPNSLRQKLPVFDLKLPDANKWRFDWTTEGWEPTGLTDVRIENGTLAGILGLDKSTLQGPTTYLNCKTYKSLIIRAKLSSASVNNAPVKASFNWSTVDKVMSDKSKIDFDMNIDNSWHDYKVDLSANPEWVGIADGFRLDIASVPGVNICFDEIVFK